MLLFGVFFLVLALEGIICLAMAAPIAMLLASLGATLGYSLALEFPDMKRTLGAFAPIFFLPFLIGAEGQSERPIPEFDVSREVIINAPPAEVWKYVLAFPKLPRPDSLWLKTGIAYPLSARISGEGVGAIRYCQFSTGAFVEPITAWEPPYRLAFDVAEQPLPMHEWSLYDDVHPPHLDGIMSSKRGQFVLEELPGGRTRQTGTTWYQNKMWPSPYWGAWSDVMIHSIHGEVLRHIKRQAEG